MSAELESAIERLRRYVDNGGLIHTASAYRTTDGRVHLIEFDDLRAVLDAASESVARQRDSDPRQRAEYLAASKANAAMGGWRPQPGDPS